MQQTSLIHMTHTCKAKGTTYIILQVYPRNIVCFRYIIVNILHKDYNRDYIIIIIIGKDTISFMQIIYTHILETNHVPKQHNVAAILLLLFMVSISLALALALMYFYNSTFRSMCAVPSMAVFCSSLTSRFPGMVLTCFLNDLKWFQSLQLLLVSP
jgi:hypothetical protein